MTTKDLVIMFGLKEKSKLHMAILELQLQLNEINDWFAKNDKINSKVNDDIEVRQKYSAMYNLYEDTVYQFRLATYYEEML